MTWIEHISACFSKCCGNSNKEYDGFVTGATSSFQSTYTVRRISSFGQTITDEKGEEKEIGRHSSVVTYDGHSAPWTSKPAPVQPGVTYTDIKKQVDKMPPITEFSTKQKNKHRWKKTGISSNKEIVFSDMRRTKPEIPENIQLKAIKYKEFGETNRSDTGNSSHENLFSKCTRKTSNAGDSTSSSLTVPSLLMKSVSTPDLVDGEIKGKSKSKNLKGTVQLSRSTEKKIAYHTPSNQVDGEIMEKLQKKTLKGTGQLSSSTEKQLASQAPSNQEQNDTTAEKLAREHGLDLSLYTKEAFNESMKSMNSAYVQNWIEEPIGTLVLSIDFNTLQKMLNVTILSLPMLCGAGIENENYPTIIKLSLIGSKKYSKTSKRIEAEWRLTVNQYFSFLIKDMDFRSLRFLVYNADWMGKHDAMGYGYLSLQHLLEKSENIQLKLYSQPNFGSDIGMMQITFGYDGIMFSVTVDKIFNYDLKLQNWKVYTKIAYYSLSKKVKERISNLVWSEMRSSELEVGHSAAFRVEPSGKKHSYIMITVKRGNTHGVFKSDESLGTVTLGPSYYYQDGKQLTPWGLALTKKQLYSFSFKIFG